MKTSGREEYEFDILKVTASGLMGVAVWGSPLLPEWMRYFCEMRRNEWSKQEVDCLHTGLDCFINVCKLHSRYS